jgi:hypothetical protein
MVAAGRAGRPFAKLPPEVIDRDNSMCPLVGVDAETTMVWSPSS